METKKSLFDDIFRLQNAAPDYDIDPEDPEDGVKARLADVTVPETESLGPSKLRKQTAIISDDPRYKGRKTSRKDLYSDEDEAEEQASSAMIDGSGDERDDFDNMDYDDEQEDEEESEDGDDDDDDDEEEEGDEITDEEKSSGFIDGQDTDQESSKKDNVKILPESKSNDRKKGKAVVHQLGVWDDLIKSRIVVQKLVTACNRLPQPDVWSDFCNNASFRQEVRNVHSSVRKVVSAMLELQSALASDTNDKKAQKAASGSDEEITSESEAEEEEQNNASQENENGVDKAGDEGDSDEEVDEEDSDGDEDHGEEDEASGQVSDEEAESKVASSTHLKRKLSAESVEETLAKRHADFQRLRNDTLSRWDEKTRLAHGNIKSKNFAAFEMSVLKQIEQVLVNRDRLIRRIHQKRSDYRVLGKPQAEELMEKNGSVEVEDDDDDVEMKLKQHPRSEVAVDPEIIDDNDFYHMCLRDLIEMKQNNETDPVLANKQWLEIQRLRNKQKQKVDTRASKGRKIRYNIKEKLKNYMTPYDKSLWSNEQKDDLFKALFGGSMSQDMKKNDEANPRETTNSSIVLGL